MFFECKDIAFCTVRATTHHNFTTVCHCRGVRCAADPSPSNRQLRPSANSATSVATSREVRPQNELMLRLNLLLLLTLIRLPSLLCPLLPRPVHRRHCRLPQLRPQVQNQHQHHQLQPSRTCHRFLGVSQSRRWQRRSRQLPYQQTPCLNLQLLLLLLLPLLPLEACHPRFFNRPHRYRSLVLLSQASLRRWRHHQRQWCLCLPCPVLPHLARGCLLASSVPTQLHPALCTIPCWAPTL